MSMTVTVGLVSVLIGLLGALVLNTWRASALATKLLAAVEAGEKRDREIERRQEERESRVDARLQRLDAIPVIQADVEYMKKNHSLIPELVSRVRVLETRAEFSKELRAQRRSRPDPREE